MLISGASFRADGIIFDANNSTVTQESWGLLVADLIGIDSVAVGRIRAAVAANSAVLTQRAAKKK